MTTYYVGSGGSDASSGTSWANRKLTLNGAEDVPVAAGDTVYVGPGVYRETLTLDVAGSSGNVITYIGDVTGENTDGIGGVVRITGSNNDTTITRDSCVKTFSARNYRTFRGFLMEPVSAHAIYLQAAITNIIIEDCVIYTGDGTNDSGIYLNGSTSNCTIRRCLFLGSSGAYGIHFNHGSVVNNTSHLIENCIFHGMSRGIQVHRIGGITIKNSLFTGMKNAGVQVSTALDTGQTLTVYNSIIHSCSTGLAATTTAEFTENYNNLFNNTTDRSNVTSGSNSQAYIPGFRFPLQLSGFKLVENFGELADWSALAAIAGTSESTDDFYGMARPTTSAKKSWGPIQFTDNKRETGTTRTGGVSMVLNDAGRVQFKVPVTNTSTTFSVYVQRQTNYAGTNPQLIIKQPGVADDTTTDAGSTGAWNELTTTLTPSTNTDFVIAELVSNNTATTGSYKVFFDDFTVS